MKKCFKCVVCFFSCHILNIYLSITLLFHSILIGFNYIPFIIFLASLLYLDFICRFCPLRQTYFDHCVRLKRRFETIPGSPTTRPLRHFGGCASRWLYRVSQVFIRKMQLIREHKIQIFIKVLLLSASFLIYKMWKL